MVGARCLPKTRSEHRPVWACAARLNLGDFGHFGIYLQFKGTTSRTQTCCTCTANSCMIMHVFFPSALHSNALHEQLFTTLNPWLSPDRPTSYVSSSAGKVTSACHTRLLLHMASYINSASLTATCAPGTAFTCWDDLPWPAAHCGRQVVVLRFGHGLTSSSFELDPTTDHRSRFKDRIAINRLSSLSSS